jgi:hypothetical protein
VVPGRVEQGREPGNLARRGGAQVEAAGTVEARVGLHGVEALTSEVGRNNPAEW